MSPSGGLMTTVLPCITWSPVNSRRSSSSRKHRWLDAWPGVWMTRSVVSAPMATVAIKIDLPPAQAPKDPTDKKPTFISVRRGGEVYVIAQTDTQKVDLSGLGAVLNVKLGANATTQSVLVRADRDVRYREFMAVVNQLQKDGFYKVGLISENLG